MIPEAHGAPARAQRRATLLAFVALLLALGALGDSARRALSYERDAVGAGQIWRTVSAHLVHLDARHLAMNVAALLLLAALYGRTLRLRDWFLAGLTAAVAVSAGLYFFVPEVTGYVGLSGVLHGLWAAGAISVARESRLEAALSLVALGGKLLLERRFGPLGGHLAGISVILPAHWLGALGGLAAALALRSAREPL
jgi:rhomboid family GlyGly-CTERM serine protease